MFRKPNNGKKNTSLSQFGLLDVPSLDDDDPMVMSDDDLDLEAELAAISGEPKKHRPRKPAPIPPSNLDAMIAASLREVPSDDEGSGGDEDDPELLSELQSLAIDSPSEETPTPPPRASRPAPPPPLSTDSSTVSLLQDRIMNYSAAEKQAKENGETSRARRFGRGLKTLNDLLKQAKSGRSVNDLDIPPPVSLGKTDPQVTPQNVQPNEPEIATEAFEPEPSLPEPLVPEVVVPEPTQTEPPIAPEPTEPPPPPPRVESAMDPARQEGLQIILRRKEEFKAAALSSKHAGDKAMALEYLKVVKQFDMVVDAYKSGQDMDLSELPTPESLAAELRAGKEQESVQHNAEPTPPPAPAEGLITASTLDEALRQRLAAFQQQEAKAKEEGNSSKARRMGRIVKQYQEAIKLKAAGKPIATDELPTPAGHGPLPTGNTGHPAPSPARPAPSPVPSPQPSRTRPAPTRHDKQLAFLLHRQKEFKDAAIRAKRTGNIEQAKEYLRAAKGFDSLIEAARGGLAVDLKSLPLPPNEKDKIEQTFDVVNTEDCTPPEDISPVSSNDTNEDALTKLSQQLTSQLKICLINRDHYREMGNVAEMNRFEHQAMKVKQDLDVVVVAKSLGQITPKFHYEQKQFSVVQCNTDLNENDLELTIVRGIAFNVPNPKDIDTYVKFEFPYPQEAPISDRTQLIKDTNSPVYNAVFPLVINRSARPCQRVFKRHGIKLEVYSRGECMWCCSGWFTSDKLLGTAHVKLAPLETQITIHEALPIMDGRRPAGGSIEIKLRVRTPILQQQFDNSSHRWLVIDN